MCNISIVPKGGCSSAGAARAADWLVVRATSDVVYAKQLEDCEMLRLALTFLVIAIVAAFFGFGLVAGMAYDAAKIFFFIFVVLAVLAFIGGALRSPPV